MEVDKGISFDICSFEDFDLDKKYIWLVRTFEDEEVIIIIIIIGQEYEHYIK